jgi:large subunit ribosomal protein L10
MITKDKKKDIVADLAEKFKKTSGFYIVNFKGMSVEDAIRIRRELKKIGVDYKVAKNTLVNRAIQAVGGINLPDEALKGESAIIFGYTDAVAPAKIIKEQFTKFEKPILKAAMIEGQYFDASQLNVLAALPSKDDMMASIVGSLHAPITGIVGSINAVMRDVASLIEEVAKKKAS